MQYCCAVMSNGVSSDCGNFSKTISLGDGLLVVKLLCSGVSLTGGNQHKIFFCVGLFHASVVLMIMALVV